MFTGRMLPEHLMFRISDMCPWRKPLVLVALALMMFSLYINQAGAVTTPISFNYSVTNTYPLPIPGGLGPITFGLSASISGSVTVKDPAGNVIANVSLSGLGPYEITLNDIGTYSVSGSYTLVLSGNALGFSAKSPPFNASDESSFNNPIPGGIGKLTISSSLNLSVTGTSGDISASISGLSVSISTTGDIDPGESASATVGGTWTVGASVPVEAPPVIETGTVSVSTNLEEATFSLSGPASYSGSGKSWSRSGASVGQYTITYGQVAGYITPSSQTNILTKDGSISFSGNYQIMPTGSIEVVTNLEQARYTLSGPKTYNGNGELWTESGAPVGQYTINYGNVDRYITPPPETKILNEHTTITFYGQYEPIPTGSIEVVANLEQASYTLSGPKTYNGYGKSWTQSEAPTGEYTIEYRSVFGYRTPLTDTKTLTKDATITFSGEYIVIASGTIEVVTNLEGATFSLSGPTNYSGYGELWTQSEAPAGNYTITYDPVEGYDAPPQKTLTLSSGGAIRFTGEYIPLKGTIEVVTNLEGATFDISGPTNYSGSGVSWTQSDAPAGDYIITYNPVEGYEAPPQETLTLTKDATIRFAGEYILLTGTIEVVTNLEGAAFDISGPTSFSGSGVSWTQSEAPIGDYTITYHQVEGYEPPPQEIQTLAKDGVISFSGEYALLTGTIEVVTNLKEATFLISGPVEYRETDFVAVDSEAHRLWTKLEAPVGDYTVTYDPVEGFEPPPQETQTLVKDDVISFTGEYVFLTGTIEVVTNLEDATFDISGPAEYSGDGKSWAQEKTPIGDYTITYSPVKGYGTPPQEALKLIRDSVIVFTGAYTPIPAAIYNVEVYNALAKAGDTIIVSVSGDAEAVATFSIMGVVSDVSMTEDASSPGLYSGEYVVAEGVDATNAVLSVKLVSIAGVETVNEDKTVTIDNTPPAIQSVNISGVPARKAGDVITVNLLGEAGGVATFSIAGIMQNIQMLEDTESPGAYSGSYIAPEGLNVKEAKLAVNLADALGNTSTDESKTVSILTAPWDVNMDKAVDLLDIEIIGSNLGKSATPELDINGDDAIDALDLALVGFHFGERYGESGGILVAAKPLSFEMLAPFNVPYYAFQNYPNPCNPGTWIPFMLARGGEVTVAIYSLNGQLIRRLELGHRDPGVYMSKEKAAYWDGKNGFGEEAASGVYFYHLKSGDFSAIRKILVLR
jgi:hypothetical protein